jgi:hypothetical protein
MSTDPDTFDARTDADQPRDFETTSSDDRPPVELRSVVVNYEQQPDRRTVYPDGLCSAERMATWLSADAAAFVDLESFR